MYVAITVKSDEQEWCGKLPLMLVANRSNNITSFVSPCLEWYATSAVYNSVVLVLRYYSTV